MRTCSAPASAAWWTATEPSPIARRLRMTRQAISPRLAISTLRMEKSGSTIMGSAFGREIFQPAAGGGPVGGNRHRQVQQDLRQRLALRVMAQRGGAAAPQCPVQHDVEAVESRPVVA